jgi:FixJ family two-component response regulator
MPKSPPVVCVVDDDESVRESLEGLLRSAGFVAHTFPSARAFLDWDACERTDCLVLDYVMSPMNGAELQQALAARGRDYPIVFVTAVPDEALQARLVAAGAALVLSKPFDDETLVDVVRNTARDRA